MVLQNQNPPTTNHLTSVRDGKVVKTQSNDEVRKEELKKAEGRGDKEMVANLTEDVKASRGDYKEFLYKTQDLYTKKITQKQIELQNAQTQTHRDMILQEVAQMGAFCRAIEEELRFLRRT